MSVVDSNLQIAQAIGKAGPKEILSQQDVLTVQYWGFDNLEHQGQIVINKLLSVEVQEWFELASRLKFPIEKVAPAVLYDNDDDKLMALNVSSGFNYRKIAGTSKLSRHAMGRAFDINPRQNPYIRKEGSSVIIAPSGAVWDSSQPGTLFRTHELVRFMLDRGWIWGGDWSLEESGRIDYQNFESRCWLAMCELFSK